MSIRRCRAVSLHCVNYAASVILSRRPLPIIARRCFSSQPAGVDHGNGMLVGLPAYLIRRLQSVQNAVARLILRLRHSDHITDALVSLHWLAYECRKGLCSRSLCRLIGLRTLMLRWIPLAVHAHRWRPVLRVCLFLPSNFQLSISRRHNLPSDITSSPFLLTFKQRLKIHLFRRFYTPVLPFICSSSLWCGPWTTRQMLVSYASATLKNKMDLLKCWAT